MCGLNASRFSLVIDIQLPWLGLGCIVAEFRFLLSEFYRGFIYVISQFYLCSIAVFSEEISKIQNEQFSQRTKSSFESKKQKTFQKFNISNFHRTNSKFSGLTLRQLANGNIPTGTCQRRRANGDVPTPT